MSPAIQSVTAAATGGVRRHRSSAMCGGLQRRPAPWAAAVQGARRVTAGFELTCQRAANARNARVAKVAARALQPQQQPGGRAAEGAAAGGGIQHPDQQAVRRVTVVNSTDPAARGSPGSQAEGEPTGGTHTQGKEQADTEVTEHEHEHGHGAKDDRTSLTGHVAAAALGAAAGTAAAAAAVSPATPAAAAPVGGVTGRAIMAAGALGGAVVGDLLLGGAKAEDVETDKDVEREMEAAADKVVHRLREAKASGALRSRRKHVAGSEAADATGGGGSCSSGGSSGDGHGHGAETGQRDV